MGDGWALKRRAWLAGAASLVARPAWARLAEVHPLAGQAIELAVLGMADWRPSVLVREMAPVFAAFAKEQYGYDVTVRYEDAPMAALYERASAGFAAKSAEFSLLIADSQWLGAFASQKWILPLNPILEVYPELDVEWYAPVVREAYQLFPDGSNNRWGLPQSGDVMALFVRRDLLTAPGEADAFRAKFGLDLPQRWEDFEALTWEEYGHVAAFFDRPGQHGLVAPMSAALAASFMLGRGGRLWDAKSGQVEGVLDTDGNAVAFEQYLSLLKDQADVGLFAAGQAFSALQWVGAAASMMPAGLGGQVLVVPPPGFRTDGGVVRPYVIGGQTWVLNDRNDEAHTRVAVDFLKWWYRPETVQAFAAGGGLPCDKASLAAADFDGMQPWSRTYRAMLTQSSDFWHDPKFVELLAAHQGGLALLASGKLADPKLVLALVACRQQMILFQEGSAERRPGDACRSLER